MKKSNAYSLVELLVVMFIFSIFATIVAQSVALIIRGNQKSENISEIKQNLDYILNVMSRRMRNARTIQSASCTGSQLVYINQSGVQETFTCNSSNANDVFIEHTAVSGTALGRLSSTNVRIVNCSTVFNCTDDSNVIVHIVGNDRSGGAIGASHSATTRFLVRQ